MLRVMLLSTDLEKGGLPLRLANLAHHLKAAGIEPVVGCLAQRGPLHQSLESDGIETFACDASGALDSSCLVRFARHLRRIDPDLIHASLFHANLAARLCGRLDRPRPILTSTVTIEIERPLHRWMEALTSGLSDCHVANSHAVADHLQIDLGFAPERLEVIPNGIDLDQIDQIPSARRCDMDLDERAPLIVWAGRMDPVKNLETFVDVVARVHQQYEVRVLILGDGPKRACITTLINKKGLKNIIAMPGWSDAVAAWLKTADILLFPSRTEGCPNVILEAMACGCAVVASDAPGCAELIQSGRTGELSAFDDVQGFAHRVHRLLIDPQRRNHMAEEARSTVSQRHNIQDVVDRWCSTYDRLMMNC